MGVTIGIDLGVTSVGWAVVDNHTIIKLGTHIFPVGVQEDAYQKTHAEKPKNEARRMARGIRRLNQRYKLRRKRLSELLAQIDAFPDQEQIALSSRELYMLRKRGLDEALSLKEFGRILFLLNQRRGFKSNRKEKAKEGEDSGIVKTQIAELEQLMKETGARTVGEYFANLFNTSDQIRRANPDAPIERIRKRFVGRKQYEDEFEKLWEFQKKFHPALTNEMKTEIGARTIFYQRKLKSAKDLVNDCAFEKNRKCIPKSHPLFQAFRTWQHLTALRVSDSKRDSEPLTVDEMQIAERLFRSSSKKISKTQIVKALSLGKQCTFNDVVDDLQSESTFYRISEALGREPDPAELEWIWHTLHSGDDDLLLKQTFLKRRDGKGLPKYAPEVAAKLVEITLEPDYGRLSRAAIQKILPFLKQGNVYSKACELAGYHHSLESALHKNYSNVQDYMDEITNPLVKRAVNEGVRVIRALQKKYNPDEVRIEFIRELNMPKDVRETINKRNRDTERRRADYIEFLQQQFPLWEKVTREDLIKFELFLELEYNERDLQKIQELENIPDLKKLDAQIARDQILRYRLWKECSRVSLYTGKPISLSKLFTPEIHVEHIIPYSRSYDDSFSNKTLCEAEVNDLKKNKTPFEYFEGNQTEWKAFKKRVVNQIEGRKKDLLLMERIELDWQEKQLSNTAHAAKTLKSICSQFLFKDKKVEVSNGSTTAILRKLWGLDRLLSGKEGKKTREDHRHHALDALVVACKKRAAVQKLSTLAGINFKGRLELSGSLDFPFAQFREQAKDALDEVFVTYRKADRLISKRKNPYKYWKKGKTKPQQLTLSARGGLHNETFYGLISDPADQQKEVFVTRKEIQRIESEKHIAQIVDKGIQKILRNQLSLDNGDFKKAFKDPIEYRDKKGRTHFIRHVRMRVPDSLIELREGKQNNVFVASGSNYGMAIYQSSEGKRKYFTLSFINAVRLKQEGRKLYPSSIDDFNLLCFLQINDLVVMYETSPEEINWDDRKELLKRLFRIVKTTTSGTIVFGRANRTGFNADLAPSVKDLLNDENGLVIRASPNTFKGVKVRIDLSGSIYRL